MCAKKTAKVRQTGREERKSEFQSILDRLKVGTVDPDSDLFEDYPITQATLKGLAQMHFREMTPIQRLAIPVALRGRDLLGSAKTGSGKTLAFLVPILERLYHERWMSEFGVGAIVLSPTRELALQTFEVLKKIGTRHQFSAGLIVGGNQVNYEKKIVGSMAIIIATPGRLLHHMDTNATFKVDECQILVLDEADRMLDLGFSKEIDAIVNHLPAQRQTMLFSATQTKSVSELARLSLHKPVFLQPEIIASDLTAGAGIPNTEKAMGTMASLPAGLEHKYLVVDLPSKVHVLFSFIKNHLRDKIIVFVATCSQAKFIFELFRQLRPGTSMSTLHGSLKQNKRLLVYRDFVQKTSGCMIATDVAARGLDFPGVNWIVMADCPMDAQEYIHRAGRTARFQSTGKSLLFLLPSEEEGMMHEFYKVGITTQKIHVNPEKTESHLPAIESVLAMDNKVKEMAKKAFVNYAKSVYFMKNKNVFDIHRLPLDEFAISIGLIIPPRVRFIERAEKQKQLAENGETQPKKKDKKAKQVESASSSGAEEQASEPYIEKNHLLDHNTDKEENDDDDDDDDEEWLTVRPDLDTDAIDGEKIAQQKIENELERRQRKLRKMTKKALRLNLVTGTKVVFNSDEEDQEGLPEGLDPSKPLTLEERKVFMSKQDAIDKLEMKRRVKEKHKKQREAIRKRKNGLNKDESGESGESSESSESDESGESNESGEPSGSESEEGKMLEGEQPNPAKRFRANFERTNTINEEEDMALKLLTG